MLERQAADKVHATASSQPNSSILCWGNTCAILQNEATESVEMESAEECVLTKEALEEQTAVDGLHHRSVPNNTAKLYTEQDHLTYI